MILLHTYDPYREKKDIFVNDSKIVIAWQEHIGINDPTVITKMQMENGKVFDVIETPEEIALQIALFGGPAIERR